MLFCNSVSKTLKWAGKELEGGGGDQNKHKENTFPIMRESLFLKNKEQYSIHTRLGIDKRSKKKKKKKKINNNKL